MLRNVLKNVNKCKQKRSNIISQKEQDLVEHNKVHKCEQKSFMSVNKKGQNCSQKGGMISNQGSCTENTQKPAKKLNDSMGLTGPGVAASLFLI